MSADRRQINFDVTPVVHARLQTMAKTAGMSTSAYARLLFEAAYSARCNETGDLDLDTAVSRVALLFGTAFDERAIRRTTGLSGKFVIKTIAAWQKQLRSGPAPSETKVVRHA